MIGVHPRSKLNRGMATKSSTWSLKKKEKYYNVDTWSQNKKGTWHFFPLLCVNSILFLKLLIARLNLHFIFDTKIAGCIITQRITAWFLEKILPNVWLEQAAIHNLKSACIIWSYFKESLKNKIILFIMLELLKQ